MNLFSCPIPATIHRKPVHTEIVANPPKPKPDEVQTLVFAKGCKMLVVAGNSPLSNPPKLANIWKQHESGGEDGQSPAPLLNTVNDNPMFTVCGGLEGSGIVQAVSVKKLSKTENKKPLLKAEGLEAVRVNVHVPLIVFMPGVMFSEAIPPRFIQPQSLTPEMVINMVSGQLSGAWQGSQQFMHWPSNEFPSILNQSKQPDSRA